MYKNPAKLVHIDVLTTNFMHQSLQMKIQTSNFSFLLCFTILCVLTSALSSFDNTGEKLVQCLTNHSTTISKVIYRPNDVLYLSIFESGIQNLHFASQYTRKPILIVTPMHESEIQGVIYCSKMLGVHMKIRGGGHDFEGLSYVSTVEFVLLDMVNLNEVRIDVENRTAWVQGGANLGELYYSIAQESQTLGFPGGIWSTVGISGHISGGGYGMMLRKFGLAADHVIDARLIDVNGRILDRISMGEDLFWAIRGGGGSSFGVITGWKINLVVVPEIVTVFQISKTYEQNAIKLLHRWQYVATKIDNNLFIRPRLRSGLRNIVQFNALFLGNTNTLLSLMQKSFPQLGLAKENCTEMSWIESVKMFSGFSIDASHDMLLNRSAAPKFYSKAKSDYATKPISEKGLEGMWKKFFKHKSVPGTLELNPYGGRMSEISESDIPFPHRAESLFMLYEGVFWDAQTSTKDKWKRINWIRSFYKYLGDQLSESPSTRGAYVNYNDLDLGVGNETYAQASIWGMRYFKNNFKRLVQVKNKFDPDNFFHHLQSIPPISMSD